jgi:hypothetical protein
MTFPRHPSPWLPLGPPPPEKTEYSQVAPSADALDWTARDARARRRLRRRARRAPSARRPGRHPRRASIRPSRDDRSHERALQLHPSADTVFVRDARTLSLLRVLAFADAFPGSRYASDRVQCLAVDDGMNLVRPSRLLWPFLLSLLPRSLPPWAPRSPSGLSLPPQLITPGACTRPSSSPIHSA